MEILTRISGRRAFALTALFICMLPLFVPVNVQAQAIPKITVGETSDADKLNPLTNFSATGSYINEYLFSSLLRTDKATGNFVPVIAAGLPTVTEGGAEGPMVYTYRIHGQAKFNGGEKLNAHDVAFSLKMVMNPFVDNSQKRVHYEDIQSMKVLDDQTIEIRVAGRNPQGMRVTSDFAILSEEHFDPDEALRGLSITALRTPKSLPMEQSKALKAVAQRINIYGSTFASWESDATCGPYVLSNWQKGKSIVLMANKKFWGKKLDTPPNAFFKQNVGEIHFQIIKNEAEIRTAAFGGGLDLVTTLSPALYFELSDIPAIHKKYAFHSPPGPSYEYVGLNCKGRAKGRNGILDDPAVRRAVAHLVHVDLLMEEVRFGLGTRIASDFPSHHQDYRNEDLKLIDFDPKKAGEILGFQWMEGQR